MPHTNIYSARPRIQPTFYSDSRSNQKPTNLAVNPILVLKKAADINAGSRYFCESLFWASQPKQAKNVSGLAFWLIL